MIKQGNVRVFDSSLAQQQSFFTGGLNLKQLAFDPLVTGYAFIVWTKLPKWIVQEYPGFKAMTEKNFKGFTGLEDMELQTQQYQYGFANNDYNVAAGITKNNTEFTLRHQEYSGSPIKNMYQFWVSSISDPETGIATYPKVYGMEYAAKNHTGELMYIVTRPDVNNTEKRNIEQAVYYTNVMPKRIPLSHFDYTQGEHNLVELEIPFSGNMHISSKVDNYAKKLLATTYSFVTAGLFDPEKANVGGRYLSEFNNSAGSVQQGLGDI
ncbi:virion protein [Bacillus phage AR9]|uniref:Virion protein n=2 Tax=Bacillus phage PBS1 TaxID=10683 RepID=A0A172JI36_BPPB1|nr:virion structural protein [Bacillus phage AR9]YP_009664216.1 virion structural protein [Bacillus phage PBS1]QXN70050.1 hypothetical protein INTERNEXUS_9 [Bacillus phage vB_BspM_Internexus]WCS68252.1 hypothetical protein Goe21_01420 [Bacillus phage vB_BsuM-Goe21]AMS01211.1 virion protein [Bacillus phage AR9]AST99836.1 hypothetical protein PBI_PBS1_14 [Bacillus phage PBS1]BDE75344.1 hypothetical protein [Bacillus phage PBS1]